MAFNSILVSQDRNGWIALFVWVPRFQIVVKRRPRKFDRRPIWKLSGINSPLMMEYPAHVRDMSSIGRSHSSACFFCNIAIIEIQFFLGLCPSFPSSTSLCRFSSRSLVVVEFIVFPKIIWHILIGTWPSCTFRSRLCWFQRSWQQEAFYFSLFQINYSGVPPQNWIKSRLFLFWLSFIIPSLIAHLQFNYIALLPRNAGKKMKDNIYSSWGCRFVASRLFESVKNFAF